MASDLAGLRGQVSALLWDEGKLIWSDAQLEQAIRTALGEYNLSLDNAELPARTVKDLDGAAETTLPAEHEFLVVLGAAGFAASGRGVDRAEAYDLNEETPEALVKWGEAQLLQFRKMMGSIRTDMRQDAEAARKAELRGSAAAPWGTAGWQIDGHDGEPL